MAGSIATIASEIVLTIANDSIAISSSMHFALESGGQAQYADRGLFVVQPLVGERVVPLVDRLTCKAKVPRRLSILNRSLS